jgi:hypothetical protein
LAAPSDPSSAEKKKRKLLPGKRNGKDRTHLNRPSPSSPSWSHSQIVSGYLPKRERSRKKRWS